MIADSLTPRWFIALMPPSEVQTYAEQVIQELGDRFQMRTAKAPPHITLQAPFLWRLDREPELDQTLQRFAQQQPGVPVTLEGFAAFAPRVLYINVLKTPELLTLQANLATVLDTTLGIFDPKAKTRSFSPHMTVASRNVTRQAFKLAWVELQERSPQFEWECDRLALLLHNGQRWQVRSEFAFQAATNNDSSTSSTLA